MRTVSHDAAFKTKTRRAGAGGRVLLGDFVIWLNVCAIGLDWDFKRFDTEQKLSSGYISDT